MIARLARVLAVATIVATLTHGRDVGAQCTDLCADYNGSGTYTSADIIEITRVLYQLTGPWPDTTCLDADDHQRVNVRDVVWLSRRVFQGGPAPTCPPEQPELTPQANTDFYLVYDTLLPAGADSVDIALDLVHHRPLYGASLAVEVFVDDVPIPLPVCRSASPGTSEILGKGVMGGCGLDSNQVLLGFAAYHGALPPGKSRVYFARLPVAPQPYARRISYQFMRTDSTWKWDSPYFSRGTMAVDGDLNVLAINMASEGCMVHQTGDCDMSGTLTSADLIRLVNYVFKSGEEPLPCPAAGDVTCDVAVNSSDVIYLVNYVFKSGPAPCDVCSLVPGSWACW